MVNKRVAADVAVALAAFVATVSAVAAGAGGGSTRHLDLLGTLLAAGSTWPLLARRRWPLGVFALTTAASATLNALDYALGPPFGPTLALAFVAADDRTRARIRETAAIVLAFFGLHIAATGVAHGGFPLTPFLFGIVVWGGAFVIGDQVRQRRLRRAQREERAEHERQLAVAEERTRIARDLHDSAGHAINVILVQAGAARLLQERDPAAARAALATIEEVARETIGEIDQLVGALREDGRRRDAVEPPAGLGALETLTARHRAAGLDVTVDVQGSRPLPPPVDQAAYRILQEALTNAARHGLGGADVAASFGLTALELEVSNRARPGGSSGHGIAGMRERAALLGGSLDAGYADGVFRIRARLPYAAEAEG